MTTKCANNRCIKKNRGKQTIISLVTPRFVPYIEEVIRNHAPIFSVCSRMNSDLPPMKTLEGSWIGAPLAIKSKVYTKRCGLKSTLIPKNKTFINPKKCRRKYLQFQKVWKKNWIPKSKTFINPIRYRNPKRFQKVWKKEEKWRAPQTRVEHALPCPVVMYPHTRQNLHFSSTSEHIRGPNWRPPLLSSVTSYRDIRGVLGVSSTGPIMPRGVSLSDSCTPDRCSSSSQAPAD